MLIHKKINFYKWFLALLAIFTFEGTFAQTKVFLMEIRQEIDPRVSRYVEQALKAATEAKADLIIVSMDTYGGTVNDADKIVTMFLNYDKPVHVWINDKAYSAGALIAISCDSIFMAPGSTIGAATVVFQDGNPAPDKYQAAMRSKMRATAEAQERDPKIAEGMVGSPVGSDTSGIGNVVALTTEEAIKAGYCDGIAKSIDAVIKSELEIENYTLEEFKLSATEKIIHTFLNPWLQGILLLVILGGIYFELQTPGVGFPLLAATIAAVLYFLPTYLTGLAEYWEILLFIIGIGLILVEILIIPGFGIAGISGIVLLSAGIVLVMLNNDAFDFEFVPPAKIVEAFTVLFAALAGCIIIVVTGGARLLNSKTFRKISLEEKFDAAEGYTSNFYPKELLGSTGTSYTVLRPSGKIMIGDNIYDAYTRGEYIEKGLEVEVIAVSGTSLKVKEKK